MPTPFPAPLSRPPGLEVASPAPGHPFLEPGGSRGFRRSEQGRSVPRNTGGAENRASSGAGGIAEGGKGGDDLGGVVVGALNPNVKVAGEPRSTVYGQRLRSNEQELHPMGDEQFQELFEVAIQVHCVGAYTLRGFVRRPRAAPRAWCRPSRRGPGTRACSNEPNVPPRKASTEPMLQRGGRRARLRAPWLAGWLCWGLARCSAVAAMILTH